MQLLIHANLPQIWYVLFFIYYNIENFYLYFTEFSQKNWVQDGG